MGPQAKLEEKRQVGGREGGREEGGGRRQTGGDESRDQTACTNSQEPTNCYILKRFCELIVEHLAAWNRPVGAFTPGKLVKAGSQGPECPGEQVCWLPPDSAPGLAHRTPTLSRELQAHSTGNGCGVHLISLLSRVPEHLI